MRNVLILMLFSLGCEAEGANSSYLQPISAGLDAAAFVGPRRGASIIEVDAGSVNSGVADAESADAGIANVRIADAESTDAGIADARPPQTISTDAFNDAGVSDQQPPRDTGMQADAFDSARLPDTGISDRQPLRDVGASASCLQQVVDNGYASNKMSCAAFRNPDWKTLGHTEEAGCRGMIDCWIRVGCINYQTGSSDAGRCTDCYWVGWTGRITPALRIQFDQIILPYCPSFSSI